MKKIFFTLHRKRIRQFMSVNTLLLFLFILVFASCGYTTGSFRYNNYKILITPAVNKVNITSEDRRYSTFTSYPILLENRFTNALINKFNIDGHLKVVSKEEAGALRLSCDINEYKRETVRYTNSEDVKEQKLRLRVHMKLADSDGKILRENDIVGETSYFLTGANRKTETTAQADLIEDTVRRVLENITEEW